MMLAKKYYKVIISDIDMPIMNGLEFFKAAIQKYDHLKKRFLFLSGFANEKTRSFLKEQGVPFLPKPSPIEEITHQAIKIMHEVHKN